MDMQRNYSSLGFINLKSSKALSLFPKIHNEEFIAFSVTQKSITGYKTMRTRSCPIQKVLNLDILRQKIMSLLLALFIFKHNTWWWPKWSKPVCIIWVIALSVNGYVCDRILIYEYNDNSMCEIWPKNLFIQIKITSQLGKRQWNTEFYKSQRFFWSF
jgi:hypothetical protein